MKTNTYHRMSAADRVSARDASAKRIQEDKEYLLTQEGVKMMPLKYAAFVADISGGTLAYAVSTGKIAGFKFPTCGSVWVKVDSVVDYLRGSKLGRPSR